MKLKFFLFVKLSLSLGYLKHWSRRNELTNKPSILKVLLMQVGFRNKSLGIEPRLALLENTMQPTTLRCESLYHIITINPNALVSLC